MSGVGSRSIPTIRARTSRTPKSSTSVASAIEEGLA
jgi:hypothetical protein